MSTGLIPDEHKEHLRSELAQRMEKPVKVLVFTQEIECKFCSETRQLLQELATLNDKIKVVVYDFVADADKAKEYAVDKIPAVVFLGEKDYQVKFYGFPFGYEFQTLVEAVINVSRGRTDLSDAAKEALKGVKTPIHIQVLVTITCPHCSVAAAMALKFAIESGWIRADVIDANEFPQLALKYMVMGVPKVVINEKVEFVGAYPEDKFLEQILLVTRENAAPT